MSRKKRERAPRRERKTTVRSSRIRTTCPQPAGLGPDPATYLRTARPVRRLAGQVRLHALSLQNRCLTLESWTRPKGRGAEPNPLVTAAHASLREVLACFPRFFDLMQELEASGFSPPRKSFTADTKAGDRVSVLESFRPNYADFMEPEEMIDLLVEKKYPGKSGGLVVRSEGGAVMKVAKCHVVKLS